MRTLFAALIALTVAGEARADLGPAPSCPAGLQSAYYMGRYCAAIDCTSDEQCGGEKCIERPVCLRPKSETEFAYEGECPAAGTCSDQCVTRKICTVRAESGDPSTPPGTRHGCGCSTPGRDNGDLVVAAFACSVAGLAAWRATKARRR